MALRASKLGQEKYNKAIAKGLDRVLARAPEDERNLNDLRVAIISDLHRGARDRADDFQRSEPAYSGALGSYLERNFELWLLGDVDELWENDLDEVLQSYQEVLRLEQEFASGQGLRRFWGNHDLDWRDENLVAEKLGAFIDGTEFQEALKLHVLDQGERIGTFLLAHGHQGTDASDRFGFLSRIVLRKVWRRVQVSQGWLPTTPAQSYGLRYKHDIAMYHWAHDQARFGDGGKGPVLVAGHTHHPVFPGSRAPHPSASKIERLEVELEGADPGGRRAGAIRAELEGLKARLRATRYSEPEIKPPCYFNTGCCCFPDGDITCLELSDGQIKLVRWFHDKEVTGSEVLATLEIRNVMARVGTARQRGE